MIDVPVLVKDALREGAYRKNYRFNVLNDDGTTDFTIDNNNLVKESVSIDERMNSGDKIKFGLCEGASLEFQYFNKPNIYGRQIQSFLDVEYKAEVVEIDENGSYTIAVAGNYEVHVPANSRRFDLVYAEYGGLISTRTVYASTAPQIITYNNCNINDVISISASGAVSVEIMPQGGTLWHEIPMGFFTVDKCSRQASTGIIKVTAYNKLMSDYLDARANNLLSDLFTNKETAVSMYDIKRLLLNGFQIEEEESASVKESSGLYGSWLYGASGKLLYHYSQANPLNSLVLEGAGYAWDSTFYPIYRYAGLRWDLTASNHYRLNPLYDLSEWEADFVDYLIEFIDGAALTISGADFVESLLSAKSAFDGTVFGWGRIFGIMAVKSDNSVEYYSDFGYENNAPNIAGGFKDILNKTLTGYTSVMITVPQQMSITLSVPAQTLNPILGKFWFTGDTYSYRYKATSSTYVTDYYTPPRYPDGSIIPFLSDNPSDWPGSFNCMSLNQILNDISDADLVTMPIDIETDYTLRDILNATYETVCQYGQLDRITDLFSGVELNQSRLYPQDTLYPATNLCPGGAAISGAKSMYQKLWADEGNIHKWKYLIITYKGLDGEGNEVDKTLQRTVNADGTDNYNMSDNWIFRNLVWAAEDVGDYADAMVAKMQDMTWFPFEMWAAGLPYLETGDEIEIPLGEDTYTSYILQRTLKGIQNLQDTYINGTLDIF